MTDFPCASTKAPMRFRVSPWSQRLSSAAATPITRLILPDRRAAARMMPPATLTIPSATLRTTPGIAAAVVAVEAGLPRSPAETKGRQAPSPSTPALAARQVRSHDGSDEGVGLWIDSHTLAALQRECGAGEGHQTIVSHCPPLIKYPYLYQQV
jgi:hypothetical protein